ncbi:MAG: DUF5130 family protein [Actinomycetota bacterium]|nr:MAG: DUF5130 family protein [Actinomycetota bacterium]
MAAGEVFTADQHAELVRALDNATALAGVRFALYVGPLPAGRATAIARHAALPDAPDAVLVAVDTAGRIVEIVVGTHAVRALDDQACGLAVLSMTSSFSAGDVVGGLRTGIAQLADHARRPTVWHLDQP